MKTKTSLIALLAACAAALSQPAMARFVVVNGARLNPAEIQYLDRISCSYIANGRYWLNPNTGIWGYEGGPAQGHISDNCNARRPGLSERGLLYSPGELLR